MIDCTLLTASRNSPSVRAISSASRRAVQFRLLQQADAAGEMLEHFVAAGLKFSLAPAQILQAGAFALQFLLRPLQFRQLDLLLADQRFNLLPRGGTVGRMGACPASRRRGTGAAD